MNKANKNSIVTIDAYNNTSYKITNSSAIKLSNLKVSKRDSSVSYIANKDLIIEPLELSSSLPSEHLDNIITDKIYEELRLDPAIDYKISYIKQSSNNNKTKYQVIIADNSEFKSRVSKFKSKLKTLESVVPAPLLYSSLYQKKLLDSSCADMFIYFGDYDSFVTFYNRGKYLYSKSIKFSLDNMYDRFVQLAQEPLLTKEQFREVLSKDGLKSDNDKYRELIIHIMNECFLTINDVVIYTKRAYDISEIKRSFVGFAWGYIEGIGAYVKNYLSIDSKPLFSLYSNYSQLQDIDPIHSLMYLTQDELNSSTLELPNLTPYPKPAPISKRPAGKILSLFLGTTALFMIPIAYDYFVGLTLKGQNLVLEQKEHKLTSEANRYKSAIEHKKEELNALDKALSKTEEIYENKKGKLKKVYNKKFNYKMRSEQLAIITKILENYDIKSRNIEINDTNYFIEVESKDDKEITSFIKKLVATLDKDIKRVNIKQINFDKKEQLYKGVLNIEFKEER